MAMGTPPLVTAVGAGPELVEDGVSGRLLPPREPAAWAAAAASCSRSPALDRMGAAGPASAARFRDDVHAGEMLEIYERAAGRRRAEPVGSRRAQGGGGVGLAELIGRLRGVGPERAGGYSGDIGFALWAGGTAALALALALMLSIQAAVALVAVVSIVALHQYDRRSASTPCSGSGSWRPWYGGCSSSARGYVDNDPLSLAPFIATAAIATLELFRARHSARDHGTRAPAAPPASRSGSRWGSWPAPRAALYAFVAYLAGLSGAVLGLPEPRGVPGSTLRKVLLYGMPPLAAYAILQREIDPSHWDFSLAGVDRLRQCRGPRVGGRARLRVPERPGRARAAAGPLAAVLPHRPAGARPITLRRATLVVLALSTDLRALGLGGADRRRHRPRRGLARPQRAAGLRRRGA